ncbi:extracellular dihydrogeodin oxidase/laccase-like protein, partial [Diaporthe sp. PMI_573]
SPLGTLGAATLPLYLADSKAPDTVPWGNRTAESTNPYTDIPVTGVTRRYNFTIGRGTIAPSGLLKPALLANNQFPGPMIEANWGDWIEVQVTNNIAGPEEGTAIHWHGLPQQGTPWSDGVPSITQCPIAPGQSFVYRFQAQRPGTSWWHSHYSGQYADGLTGPIVIYGPQNAEFDIDLGPIMLSDLRNDDYNAIDGNVTTFTFPQTISPEVTWQTRRAATAGQCEEADMNCVNTPDLPKFHIPAGKRVKMRLINHGGDSTQRFGIDGHKLTVIANDFVQVKPYQTDFVTVAVGQRTDVTFEATGNPGDMFWMRAQVVFCPPSLTKQVEMLGALYYDGADTNTQPTTTQTADSNLTNCQNDDLKITKPYYPMALEEPDTQIQFFTFFTLNEKLEYRLTMNTQLENVVQLGRHFYQGNYSNPVLRDAQAGGAAQTFSQKSRVYDFGTNRTVRVVVNNPFIIQNMHPMHLHGHDIQLLATGDGNWDGKTLETDSPIRRDTMMMPLNGHIVFQYTLDNPGIWSLHCHIPWHLADGLLVNFMERPDDIKAQYAQVPQIMQETCDSWNAQRPTLSVPDEN